MRFEDAIGGTTREDLRRTGGPFLDRAPFTGTGFAPAGTAVPVWWLAPTRVPAGARLVRFADGLPPQRLADYVDVATGWVVAGGDGRRRPAQPSPLVGGYATIAGEHRLADVVGDRVAVWEPATGERREVALADVDGIFELEVLGSWNGLDVRLVARWEHDGVPMSRIAYLGHDSDLAEGLGLVKIEAGVYEASVPDAQIDAVRTVVSLVDDGR
ncbi:hypothetical protein ACGGZK_08355 [Agromyces sp. MMS24-K17]|uniref:hypothetical protein n=1 Tax=Agromyces sp. MMS24-K17 TaxID=3372850 RepID=UPI003754F8A3